MRFRLPLLLAIALLVTACGSSASSTATAPVTATESAAPTATATAAADQPTEAASSIASTSSPPAGETATPPADEQAGPPDYRDDRSTATAVLESLYNAINSKQYARAWSYWEDSEDRPSFDEFKTGYDNTEHVDLTIGTVQTGAGAGNLYYDVPVILHVAMADGSNQIFAGCYTLHLGQPSIQAEPPYHPMAIMRGDVQEAKSDADAQSIFEKGCQPGG